MEEKERENLRKSILEKTQGKLTDEQINKILESGIYGDIQVTSDPGYMAKECTEENNHNVKSEVTIIDGDIEKGLDDDYEDVYESPNFTLNNLQIVVNDNDLGRTQITIYIPDQEYPEGKNYVSWVEDSQRESLRKSILEKTQGKLTDEQINKILESGIYGDIQVTSDPGYMAKECTEENNHNVKSEVTIIDGDIEKGLDDDYEDVYESPNFTLNNLQIVVNDNDLGRTQITIYIPDEELLKKEFNGVTSFKEYINKSDEKNLKTLDELERLREQKKKLQEQEKTISEAEKLIKSKENQCLNIDK